MNTTIDLKIAKTIEAMNQKISHMDNVAAILRNEPIFTQPLGFIFRSAGAVEQLAVQGAVGVTDFRHTVLILKFCVAFVTGHQI